MRKSFAWCAGALLALTCAVALPAQPAAAQTTFPRRVAERCKGEAHFAIAPCGCVVKNRLAAGQSETEVLAAFFAQDVPAKDAEVWIIERVLNGEWPCNVQLWFMWSAADVERLGLDEADAISVVRRGENEIYFFAKDALND